MMTNDRFISLGVKFDEREFITVRNRKIYDDTFFPPTKPIEGGFWGSYYLEGEEYHSQWEKYIKEVLSLDMFLHRLNGISTIFKLKEDAKILRLDSFDDVYINLSTGQSNLALRFVKIGRKVPSQYKNHLFIDYESLKDYYDAIYVTQRFVDNVDWVLKEFEMRVRMGQNEYDSKLTPKALYIAELFEDWNVDSVLVLNPKVVIVESYV